MKKICSLLVLVLSCFLLNLQAQTPQYYNSALDGTPNSFPFNINTGKMVQGIIPPGTLITPSPAPAGSIIKYYVRIASSGSLGPATYTDFKILFAQDPMTVFTGSFYAGPMDTVYSRASVTLTAAGGSWLEFVLDHPFTFNPAQSLIVQIGHCGCTGSYSGYSIAQTVVTGFSRRNYSTAGCPFTYGGPSDREMNCGITLGSASIVNRSLKLATPGVNTTYVSVPYQASMVGFGNNITIETWIKPGGTTTAATVLNKGVASFDYQLGVSLSTMLPFFRAGANIATCPFAIQANVWQHLAVVSNGSQVIFYLNGVAGTPVTLACTLGSSSNEMRIGRGNSDAGSGGLDELRVWSVVRTGPEILSNMCNKWIPNNTAGLKAQWHFDSTCVDSVSGWNGTLMGTAGYDTLTFCPIVTNISGNGSIVPKSYSLSQNYPNPFNPTTNIKFSIPKNGYVEIKIYDILGKEITTLVSDPYQAGEYIVGFNAASLSSGVYFYRLTVNDYVATKKMTVIK
jgi:hypothetical protein